jgi:class 3 adenylate cyclase
VNRQSRESFERIAIALLALLFALATALYLREAVHGGPYRTRALVGAAVGAGPPEVIRFRSPADRDASALRIGDRLLRAGDRDLAGAAPWTVYAALYAAADRRGVVTVEVERNGRRETIREALSSDEQMRNAVLGVAFAITALLVLRRAPGSATARAFAPAALTWALAQIHFEGSAPAQTYASFAVRAVVGFLWAPLMILAAIQFPEGAWPAGRRLPRWPWLFAVLGFTWTSWFMDTPFPGAFAVHANPAIGGLVIAALLVVATRNYRLAGPAGRRQMKWVLLGSYVGLVPNLIGAAAGALHPELTGLWFAAQTLLLAIPISILIAVTRSNLLDIDRLISGTASYTILLVLFAAAAVRVLPALAEQASRLAGVEGETAQVVFAIALALVGVRAEPWLRPQLERVFFAERHALQAGIDRLVAETAQVQEVRALAELVGSRVDEMLRPELCVIYALGTDTFAPIYARRSPVTAHFDARGRLASALSQRVTAIDVERDRAFAARLDVADRAGISGVGAAVLLPIVRDGTLLAFLALGRKTSGDVYTATDLALLSVLGSSVSSAIRRFDDEELLREARKLQDQLRQFVPASIADQIVRGADVEAREREVSILFVDIRGYATWTEGRVAEEIFRLVSRYTETVTRAVRDHGGTVVEFNGDGMMAVFGAPEPLPDKERRALAAARRIVADVGSLGGRVGESPTVGVGLATGSAYVGPIRSVDRHIWSAIGNTTNLAARLERLTRELGASIVIDEPTFVAAGRDAVDFERRSDVAIRGLRTPHAVFVQSRGSLAAEAERRGSCDSPPPRSVRSSWSSPPPRTPPGLSACATSCVDSSLPSASRSDANASTVALAAPAGRSLCAS